MRNIWTIAKKEYRIYFISPVAYVLTAIILLALGIWFYTYIYYSTSNPGFVPEIQSILGFFPFVLLMILVTPAITMRSLSEEQRSGTLEVLLTAPVRDWELVVGKWLGSYLFGLTIILVTLIYPIILNQMVSPGIDQGKLITLYLGISLLISAFTAIGIASSSFFSSQVATFFTCLGLLFVLWILGILSNVIGGTTGDILRYLSWPEHLFTTFYEGVIEIKDIIYFLSLTALSLFTGTIVLETRRWR